MSSKTGNVTQQEQVAPTQDGTMKRKRPFLSVINHYERAILSGEIEVGEHLPSESEIAAKFDVGTRSVREAIQTLETKGLVRRRHGERTIVVRDDISKFLDSLATTVRQLFFQNVAYFDELSTVRRIIEVEAVDALASGLANVNEEVEAAIVGMREAVKNNDFSAFTDHDAAFHLGLVHSLNNQILSVFYNNMSELMTDLIRVGSRVPRKALKEAMAEHEAIYQSIINGNRDAAVSATKNMIQASGFYVQRALRVIDYSEDKA